MLKKVRGPYYAEMAHYLQSLELKLRDVPGKSLADLVQEGIIFAYFGLSGQNNLNLEHLKFMTRANTLPSSSFTGLSTGRTQKPQSRICLFSKLNPLFEKRWAAVPSRVLLTLFLQLEISDSGTFKTSNTCFHRDRKESNQPT